MKVKILAEVPRIGEGCKKLILWYVLKMCLDLLQKNGDKGCYNQKNAVNLQLQH